MWRSASWRLMKSEQKTVLITARTLSSAKPAARIRSTMPPARCSSAGGSLTAVCQSSRFTAVAERRSWSNIVSDKPFGNDLASACFVAWRADRTKV